jgi:hypothetical protein
MESGKQRATQHPALRATGQPERAPLLVRTFVPIKTISVANSREHWSRRQKRVKAERDATYWCLIQDGNPQRYELSKLPLEVGLKRTTPNMRRMDGDNLQSSMKAIRDAVCAWLGRDDADPTIHWVYTQDSGSTGVEIVIRPVGP